VSAARNTWFDVDKEGLGKLVERRGKAFVIFELVQNAWDCTGTTTVDVRLRWLGRDRATLIVRDDHPDGFKDLTHAYTLFAPSEKKGDPSRRGRFNLGEKLVLAICDRAQVTSTKGKIVFEPDGSRRSSKERTDGGTEFFATVKMTKYEFDEVLVEAKKILPPAGVRTVFNDVEIARRPTLRVLPEVFLQTEVSDDNGVLRRKYRDAEVVLYAPLPGEKAHLYEMGIPVVEMGDDPFHVDVRQKIPLTMERDGVPPSYLRDVRGAVLDGAHDLVTAKTAAGKWTQDAIEESGNMEAIREIVKKRYGEKVVIYDPSDVEGTKIAVARDYAVIPGGAFTGDAWDKIHEAGAALPAGQVTPSPKPFGPDGVPLQSMQERELQARHKDFRDLVVDFAHDVCQLTVTVLFTYTPSWGFRAAYVKLGKDSGQIVFNISKLGEDFWETLAKQYQLVIHELGHHWGGHLDEAYHEEICRMGGKALALLESTIGMGGRRGWSKERP
jgi:hypothetical protein